MFDADLQWFSQHRSELLKQYRGQFVAILESQVVDSDADFGELAQRVFKKYGYRDLLMPFVEEGTETLEILTPWTTGSYRLRRTQQEVGSMVTIGRLITAMVTPFNDRGDVDYAQARHLASSLLDSGSDGLVISGTTGESPTLTKDEKLRLFREIKAEVGSRGAVIAGTGNYSTAESIELTQEAEKIGVDAVLLVVPYYNKPTQEGLYQHFKAIAESTSLPCILYNVPSRTITSLSWETALRLAQVDNIIGVKEASGDFDQIARIIAGAPKGFQVWSGNDSDTFGVMTLGGYGIISVASHLVGLQIKGMMDLILAGRTSEAAAEHLRLTPMFKGLFIVSNPIPVKYCVNQAGFRAGKPRLPLTEPDKRTAEQLQAMLKGYRIDLPISATA